MAHLERWPEKMDLPPSAIETLFLRTQNLDAGLPLGGLYAADVDLIFTKVLFPLLKELGFRITHSRGGEYAYVAKKDQRKEHRLELIDISTIKVREFGGRHAFDRHVRHDSRWDGKRMERALSKLWSASSRDRSSLLLVVGYGRQAEPLKKEVAALEQAVHWGSHGVRMDSASWDDPHGRGFHTGIHVWTKTREANQSPEPMSGLAPGHGSS